jgi:transcriptional regulator with GAF, ATPase, and Fis domain
VKALETAHGKIYGTDGAAAILGMKPTTLVSRMKKMNLGKF